MKYKIGHYYKRIYMDTKPYCISAWTVFKVIGFTDDEPERIKIKMYYTRYSGKFNPPFIRTLSTNYKDSRTIELNESKLLAKMM